MAEGLNHDGSILFLSCDLQNSTQFKQTRADGWIATFLAFYSEFPSLLAAQVNDTFPALRQRLSLWKAIGDELIFSVRIQSEHECSDAVDAWLSTMNAFETQYLLRKTPMTLKGGAFLATVPTPDRRVAIPRASQVVDDGSQLDAEAMNEATLNEAHEDGAFELTFAMDFVGPSIDTGFRVLKFASRRYFVLTVEVAHLLFKHYNDQDQNDRRAYLLGTHVLKGVWSGQPYPVFAVTRELDKPTPAQALAAAYNSNAQITDEYPWCKPHDALEAVAAYRGPDGWQGAVHVPLAHHGNFQEHTAGAQERKRLDGLIDTSEDPLDSTEDHGDETTVPADLPIH